MPLRLIVEMGVPWQRDGEQKVKWPRMVNPPPFPALPPTPRKGQEWQGEAEVQQWGRGAVKGCGSHRPFHHLDTGNHGNGSQGN